MPYSMDKMCSYPGCYKLVKHGRCEDHPYLDQHNPETQRLYNSSQWKKLRALQLAREPRCEICLAAGIFTVATEVDHLTPHRGDLRLFFTGSLQSLCKNCHSTKTLKEIRGRGSKSFESGSSERAGLSARKKLPFSENMGSIS